jgi:hypothetical protein
LTQVNPTWPITSREKLERSTAWRGRAASPKMTTMEFRQISSDTVAGRVVSTWVETCPPDPTHTQAVQALSAPRCGALLSPVTVVGWPGATPAISDVFLSFPPFAWTVRSNTGRPAQHHTHMRTYVVRSERESGRKRTTYVQYIPRYLSQRSCVCVYIHMYVQSTRFLRYGAPGRRRLPIQLTPGRPSSWT